MDQKTTIFSDCQFLKSVVRGVLSLTKKWKIRIIFILLLFAFFIFLASFGGEEQKKIDLSTTTDSSYKNLIRYKLASTTNDVYPELLEAVKALKGSSSYLHLLDQPLNKTIPLTRDNARQFVFVTGSNRNYLKINLDAIGNIQRLLPNYTIIFYDLEESEETRSRDEITKIKQLCGVIYRVFDFKKYPKHVRNLNLYAWKPLIILEVLQEYPSVFWIDASIRFDSNRLSEALDQVVRNGGILTFRYASHSIFVATYKDMYRYLPISKQRAMEMRQREAGCALIYRTDIVYRQIFYWWVACAFVEGCIAPTREVLCKFGKKDEYAHCHRYDQSALNIIMANHYEYNDEAYFYITNNTLTTVERGSYGKENLTLCLPSGENIILRSDKLISSSGCSLNNFSFFIFLCTGWTFFIFLIKHDF